MAIRLRWLQRTIIPVLTAALLLLTVVWLLLAPAEEQLGNLVKLVYVHGALVWVGLVTFSVAGGLGLAALVLRHRFWYHGTRAAGEAALCVWILYAVSSMVVTGLTWGQVIAWSEPRVRATGLILVAAVILVIVARFVGSSVFAALVNLVMGIVPWIVVHHAEAIRHPVGPIGGSGSRTMQAFYGLIVATVGGLAAMLVAYLWVRYELVEKG